MVMVVPKPLADYIDAVEETEVELMADKSKHGRFISFWNPKQQMKK
jgi:hypothetical protein